MTLVLLLLDRGLGVMLGMALGFMLARRRSR